MTRQPDLYSPVLATVRTRQGRLFADDGPAETNLSCECGEPLIRTPSGYLSCGRGCGKLREDTPGDVSGSWFDTDERE